MRRTIVYPNCPCCETGCGEIEGCTVPCNLTAVLGDPEGEPDYEIDLEYLPSAGQWVNESAGRLIPQPHRPRLSHDSAPGRGTAKVDGLYRPHMHGLATVVEQKFETWRSGTLTRSGSPSKASNKRTTGFARSRNSARGQNCPGATFADYSPAGNLSFGCARDARLR